ncbi:MAG: hypothetical protein BZY88_17140 [SAR202 cluster bacterium Io17-Chloro-G9]|nr:MAG: hypothetical protein BZY88_17140 [SAR202 cluster bacterium Io17-Chloro-G9]
MRYLKEIIPELGPLCDELAATPRPVDSTQIDGDIFRIRVGQYRVIYRIDDEVRAIFIESIRRRSENTYRRIRDLF